MPQQTDGWCVSALPPDDYSQWAQDSGLLFAMPIWSKILLALGAEPLFAWNSTRRIGALIACFRYGGFRIGVLGFPVAGEPWDAMELADLTNCTTCIGKLADFDLLRVNRSMTASYDSIVTSARPEARIKNLALWRSGGSRRLRKDLAFARRANPALEIVSGSVNPAACFGFYSATIKQRGGRLRYNEDYFESLAQATELTNRLAMFTALDAGQDIRGYAALAIHGSVGYYLHSGVDAKGKREGVTDLLLESIVITAREAGCVRLTLMASPWEQSGLVRFKQKWSEQQGLASTYDFAFGVAGHCGRLVSRWIARDDRLASEAWSPRDMAVPGSLE